MRKVAFKISDNLIQASSSYAGPSVILQVGIFLLLHRSNFQSNLGSVDLILSQETEDCCCCGACISG